MKRIRVAIAGVGNCASSLVQGLEYYKGRNLEASAGLMHPWIGDWKPSDIQVVAAFDIDRRKVGKPLEEAIFAKPNCTKVFQSAIPVSEVVVQMAPVLDGVAPHMADYPDDESFRPSDEEPVDIVQVLKDTKAEVLVCYMPVGSEAAVRHYAGACLEARVALINCVPGVTATNNSAMPPTSIAAAVTWRMRKVVSMGCLSGAACTAAPCCRGVGPLQRHAENVARDDCLVTLRPHRDHVDRRADQLLDAAYVLSRRRRQVAEAAHARDVVPPPR